MAPTSFSLSSSLEPRRYITASTHGGIATPIIIAIVVLVVVVLLIIIACVISRRRTMKRRRREIAQATKFTPTGMVDNSRNRESTMMRGALGGMSTRSRTTATTAPTTTPPSIIEPPIRADSTTNTGPAELPAAETASPNVKEFYQPYRPPVRQPSPAQNSYPPAPEQLGTEASLGAGSGQRRWWGLREPERAAIA